MFVLQFLIIFKVGIESMIVFSLFVQKSEQLDSLTAKSSMMQVFVAIYEVIWLFEILATFILVYVYNVATLNEFTTIKKFSIDLLEAIGFLSSVFGLVWMFISASVAKFREEESGNLFELLLIVFTSRIVLNLFILDQLRQLSSDLFTCCKILMPIIGALGGAYTLYLRFFNK